jgi:NADPH:quinone reductase-like Zn-dependent oxidoreductase
MGMRAALHVAYGPPELLRVGEVPAPVAGEGELLICVHCTTANRTDAGFLRGRPFVTRFFSGLLRPRHVALGCAFAGEVAAVGPGVTRFAVGDRVFGFDDGRFGAHAEYKVLHQDRAVARIPADVPYEVAAASTEGGHYALCNIRAAGIGRGDRVLVHGATGAIGSAAVQLLVHLGADVVATSTTRDSALVASLGARRVVDHEHTDFTACGEQFRVVFDAVGKSSFAACRPLLTKRGIYLSTDLGRWGQNPLLALLGPLLRRVGARRVMFPIPRTSPESIEYLADRLANGDFTPVIDRVHPLDEIVEAFHRVETGQKTGNVVIRVRT